MTTIKLKTVLDTYFKEEPLQSKDLDKSQLYYVNAGEIFLVHSYNRDLINGNFKVAFKDTFLGPKNKNTWFVYSEVIELIGTEPDNKPTDSPDPNTLPITKSKNYKGKKISIPGVGKVYTDQPIISGGNFSWGEATKNGFRVPVSKDISNNIVKTATWLEEVRQLLENKPIVINSWYRPPSVNKSVGGSSKSRHLVGDAVDFYVKGLPPSQVHKIIEPWWGSRGGCASASSFTHLDSRGYKARWSYNF